MAIAEGLDGRNALNPVGPRNPRVGVDVELYQLQLARALGGLALQHRSQLAAGSTPVGPEVDHHRKKMRAIQDNLLEVALGNFHEVRLANKR